MLNITRRQLCKAAGVGAAALAISPLAACAGGGNEPVMSDAATDTPAPAPAETEPEGGYPNGTPSTLFGAPGKHAWFYGDAPSKGAKPSLLAFEDGAVTFYSSHFFQWLPESEMFSINDLIDLTDEEIIARYADAFQKGYNALEPGSEVAKSTTGYLVPAFAGGGNHPNLDEMEGGKVVDRQPLDFTAIPLNLHITTDNTGNTTVSEDFAYEEIQQLELYTSPFFDQLEEVPDIEVLRTLDLEIRFGRKEREMVIVGAAPKPFEVYTAFYSAFVDEDGNYIYTQIRGSGNNISLDQPGAQDVSVD